MKEGSLAYAIALWLLIILWGLSWSLLFAYLFNHGAC